MQRRWLSVPKPPADRFGAHMRQEPRAMQVIGPTQARRRADLAVQTRSSKQERQADTHLHTSVLHWASASVQDWASGPNLADRVLGARSYATRARLLTQAPSSPTGPSLPTRSQLSRYRQARATAASAATASPLPSRTANSCWSWADGRSCPCSGRLDQAAVDHIVDSGDVGHWLGGQHRDERGYLLGRRESAGGDR